MKILKRIWRMILLFIFIFVGVKAYQTHQDVAQVMTYRSLVREVLTETDSDASEELILAMIYTETKGRSADVMQSSESMTGTSNSITDSRQSIRQGVEVLVKNIEYAESLNLDMWTAVQAYNFGSNYIDYVAANGGENSIDLATTYSREVVAPSLGNTNAETYTYHHPIALIHGGKLYVNGGNIYYSRQVRTNMYIIEVMNWF